MNAAKKTRDPRTGLRTSSAFATVLCIIGHLWLGFEQAWMDVVVALATGYACNLLFEWVDAKANDRPVGFRGGGFGKLFDFLLSAHMTSITLSFILYSQDRWWPMALAVATAIGSKFLFRVRIDGRYRHFLNPSNVGLTYVLLVFPWTTAIPWMYTAEVSGIFNVILPCLAIVLGLRLNILFTQRIPAIAAWLVAFIFQGVARAVLLDTPLTTELVPLTGFPVILFALYMITDPMTSPSRPRNQVIFGACIAFAYGALMLLHVRYALFYSVTVVGVARGLVLFVEATLAVAQTSAARTPASAVEGSSVGTSG